LSAIKQRGGDYERKGLGEAMRSARLIGDAVGHYRQHCGGAPAIAFTVDIAHAEAVKEDFSTAGYAAAVLTGSTPKLTRAQMIADLGTGQLNVLASCNVISEGTDIPRVEAAILLRPTLSYGLAMQQMGRALRSFPGKSRAIILDHASNTHKHGLPTETVRWSLDSVVKRSGQGEALKTCFDCGASMGIRVAVCPLCGKILSSPKEMEEGEQEDAFPVVREGHLVEMTPERRAQLREWRKKAERKASHYADFQAIGQVMGYKPGWAKYRYEELKNGN
jgi:superfamily II DNA or RNA helicase